jgi:hypothetical protein
MDQTEAIALLSEQALERGFTHISPEAITAIVAHNDEHGWPPKVRPAYNTFMDGMRRLFEPVGGW